MSPHQVDARVLVPDPRLKLDEEGRWFWTTFAPELAAAGRLQFVHLPTWMMLVDTWSLYRRAVKATPKRISPKVFPPAIAIARQARLSLIHLCGRFGLDPATDARLRMGGEDPLSVPPVNSGGSSAPAADRSADWMRVYGAAPGA